jgi:hypothetical protein
LGRGFALAEFKVCKIIFSCWNVVLWMLIRLWATGNFIGAHPELYV